MPVGVPKVPFRNPGEEDATWVELYNRLYRERLLFLGQEVKEEISNTIVGLMVYLSIEDQTRDLYLFINSPGGWVISGIAIFDTMQFVTPDVHTICMGIAASMASFILVGGEITKRLAFPHAWIMIHQPASSFYDGRSGDFFRETRQIVKLRETLTKVYVQRTGMPLWVVAQDMERDIFMSATEAQAHGIVDLVGADPEDFEDFLL
uniref:ATP-dependent Clp protease proteolytic subunit n=1 Tax=Kaempferia parviflora TaxID=97751 RepID=UPI0027A66750|nr:ATP-dependent Clp protease proteolytic subunit [Kaempferia parviflora]YP_011035675.1 ATP-dependent Clp protease proteolytic subunit [Cornukaempferia aurantiflora]WIM35539.1 ATP-dependent Clp protease proteolytic subunit 1 [Curcuma longa]WIM51352.1 ATP-dependent Clp protease proteolytic subunit 1 [Curcuma wenyujin]WIM51438.1 ATP-dependent Clp protease proteolytic subunit 1 [Curcuma phaeocaulis]WRI59900.1 ATP-dependent Clp protease proteolytic subunit [Kaempferia parviflora]WRI59987.1 ATP-de